MPVIPRFSLSLSPRDLAFLGKCVAVRPSRTVIDEFEEKLSSWLGSGPALFVPSARAGLFGLLKILDIPPGSKVILPAWTHPSVPAAVVAAGLTPSFVDIDPSNLNMDPDALTPAALEGARAVIATHLYGTPCPIEEIQSIAAKHDLFVIEDCAQSLGAAYRGKKTGTLGDAAYFSFALTKNFTTLGGGAIVVNRGELREKLRALAGSGIEKVPIKDMMKAFAFACGTNPLIFALTLYPLLRLASLFSRDPLHDAFQERISVKEPGLPLRRPSPVRAKLGLRQLAAIEENNLRRREVGAALLDLLKDLPREILPDPPPDGEPIFMSFVLKVRDRKRVARDLLAKGVDTSPGYLRPCYNLDPFTQFAAQCPVAEEMAEKQLHLPIYPGLSKKRIDHIAGCVRRALTRN